MQGDAFTVLSSPAIRAQDRWAHRWVKLALIGRRRWGALLRRVPSGYHLVVRALSRMAARPSEGVVQQRVRAYLW